MVLQFSKIYFFIPDLHWSTVLSVFGCVGFFSTFTMAVIIDGEFATKHIFPSRFEEWAGLAAVGVLSFVIQVCFTKALQLEMASTASLERKATDVIFAFVFQITIFMVCMNLVSLICKQLINRYILKYITPTRN